LTKIQEMNQCKFCGRNYDGPGLSDTENVFQFLFSNNFCSLKCKSEYQKLREQKSESKRSENDYKQLSQKIDFNKTPSTEFEFKRNKFVKEVYDYLAEVYHYQVNRLSFRDFGDIQNLWFGHNAIKKQKSNVILFILFAIPFHIILLPFTIFYYLIYIIIKNKQFSDINEIDWAPMIYEYFEEWNENGITRPDLANAPNMFEIMLKK
jgi:hypothetical protein